VFPGLGHAYLGRYRRAVAYAALPLLLMAYLVGLFLHYGTRDFGLWLSQTSVLGPLAIINMVLLAYRTVATVDAYRLAAEEPHLPFGLDPVSAAGLAAVLLIMAAGHVIVGYWDIRLYNLARDIHAPIAIATPDPSSSDVYGPILTYAPGQSIQPATSVPPWDGKSRLNILLVGVDRSDRWFHTDSMIVVSLDPKTHKVAMFSIPRDTYALPLPPNSCLSSIFGSTYNRKLNTLWMYANGYRDCFPGGGADALKQALGYTYGLDIQYYVLVDFGGFRKVIDTLGGVTVNVPAPVRDDGYPGNFNDGQHLRIYIPAGIQHMTGDEALTYARSRKGSGYYDDYNRSARQEQILVAIQQQADPAVISAHLGDLIDALSGTVRTDIPEGPGVMSTLLDEAGRVNIESIDTYAFSPPTYGNAGMLAHSYVFIPYVDAMKATVKAAISGSGHAQDQMQELLDEYAPIVVENGTGVSGQETTLAAYLRSLGLNAQSGTTQPAQTGGRTRLVVMNGADGHFPATFAFLEKTLGLSGSPLPDTSSLVQAVTDPDEAIGFVIITGTDTPNLTAPPG
jgi:LCP family protein required for cell wall assembly